MHPFILSPTNAPRSLNTSWHYQGWFSVVGFFFAMLEYFIIFLVQSIFPFAQQVTPVCMNHRSRFFFFLFFVLFRCWLLIIRACGNGGSRNRTNEPGNKVGWGLTGDGGWAGVLRREGCDVASVRLADAGLPVPVCGVSAFVSSLPLSSPGQPAPSNWSAVSRCQLNKTQTSL